MPQADKGGLFIKFPLDDIYLTTLLEWKSQLEKSGQLLSLREILEREIVKLDRTVGITEALQLEQVPLIYDAPTNCERVPVRLKNENVINAILEASEISHRSISKVMYTLVRMVLDNSALAPFKSDEIQQTG